MKQASSLDVNAVLRGVNESCTLFWSTTLLVRLCMLTWTSASWLDSLGKLIVTITGPSVSFWCNITNSSTYTLYLQRGIWKLSTFNRDVFLCQIKSSPMWLPVSPSRDQRCLDGATQALTSYKMDTGAGHQIMSILCCRGTLTYNPHKVTTDTKGWVERHETMFPPQRHIGGPKGGLNPGPLDPEAYLSNIKSRVQHPTTMHVNMSGNLKFSAWKLWRLSRQEQRRLYLRLR